MACMVRMTSACSCAFIVGVQSEVQRQLTGTPRDLGEQYLGPCTVNRAHL